MLNGDNNITRKHKLKMTNILNSSEYNNSLFNVKRQTLRHHKQKMANILNSPEFNTNFLNIICKDSKICLDFGNYGKQVNDYFDNFQNFKFAKPATRIGEPSSNGAVLLIPFEKNGYKTFALLKFSISKEADNLMYEAYVGIHFINNYVKIFPLFTETYGYFLLRNNMSYLNIIHHIKNNIPLDINKKIDIIYKKEPYLYTNSCNTPTFITPLIQYFKDFSSLGKEFLNNFANTRKELPCLLYQVFFTLDILKDKYTHYDLHANNAGYYKPFTNKYILMNYHLENGNIISFPTIYISKIIDYGRCHFNKEYLATKDIIDVICRRCPPDCGIEIGYEAIQGMPLETADASNTSFYWINPIVKNCSHDLRLIANFKNILKTEYNFFNDIIYLHNFGTPENLTPYDKTEKIIRNVSDARESLEDFLPNWCETELTEKYYINAGITKAAEIHVYEDGRPYEYIINTIHDNKSLILEDNTLPLQQTEDNTSMQNE
jgi:hypothetical protein